MLPFHLKEAFKNKKEYLNIFFDYDEINYCMMMVNERVRCYKSEVGGLLDKIGN